MSYNLIRKYSVHVNVNTHVLFIIVLSLLVYSCKAGNKNRSGTTQKKGNINYTQEPLRPQFHFTASEGTISDPNGLVYYNGIYHLFFQYNRENTKIPVPQHWGHAVSKDLIHWEQLPNAISPHNGGNIYSGSAVVDHKNTSGLQVGAIPPIIAFYTWHKNFTQRMVYSNDGGETWTEFKDNPVIPHIYKNNRDPKVFWHEESGKWVMVLYVKGFDFFGSTDLKSWTHLSTSNLKLHECPDFFELPVNGTEDNSKWVLLDASGAYYIGDFDGKKFSPESGPHLSDWNGKNKIFYATQTWSNIPGKDGRRIQIAGMRDDRKEKIPSENFNNQMTFPTKLSLRTTDEGIRLFRYPIKEIEKLYVDERTRRDIELANNEKYLLSEGKLLDIKATFEVKNAASFHLDIKGTELKYDGDNKEITFGDLNAPLETKDGELDLRLLVDRSSIELFGNGGRISISKYFLPGQSDSVFVKPISGKVQIAELASNKLKSIWE